MYDNKNSAVDILLVGNNPMEMSEIYDNLKGYKRGLLQMQITFELKGLLKKIIKLNPKNIVIDNKYKREELQQVVASLMSHSKTRHIPITLIKHSNYEDVQLGVDDYVLSSALTASHLMASVKHSTKFRATNNYLKSVYSSRKSSFMSWMQAW